MKLSAASFGPPELAYDMEIVMSMATISTVDMSPIGSAFNPPYEADVFWMPTRTQPAPSDQWLHKHMPTGPQCVVGFRNAFEQYVNDWCGAQMREELLGELSGTKLEMFRNDGWLPFAIPDPIYINAEAKVIVYKCICHIDYNLEEHGVEVSWRDGRWKFGYIGNNMEYFEYWENDG